MVGALQKQQLDDGLRGMEVAGDGRVERRIEPVMLWGI